MSFPRERRLKTSVHRPRHPRSVRNHHRFRATGTHWVTRKPVHRTVRTVLIWVHRRHHRHHHRKNIFQRVIPLNMRSDHHSHPRLPQLRRLLRHQRVGNLDASLGLVRVTQSRPSTTLTLTKISTIKRKCTKNGRTRILPSFADPYNLMLTDSNLNLNNRVLKAGFIRHGRHIHRVRVITTTPRRRRHKGTMINVRLTRLISRKNGQFTVLNSRHLRPTVTGRGIYNQNILVR